MAFSHTIADRISFGNKKCVILNLTDVQDTPTTLIMDGMDTVHGIKASNMSDSADHFGEKVGAKSATATRNQISIGSATSNDDGIAWVWGN